MAAGTTYMETMRVMLPQELGRKPVNSLLDKSRLLKLIKLAIVSAGKVPANLE